MREQLTLAFYCILSSWSLMLVTGTILALLYSYADLNFSSALFAFISIPIGFAWVSAPLVSERKNSATKSRKNTSKRKKEKVIWGQLIESIPDPVFILGAQNKIIFANEQAITMIARRQPMALDLRQIMVAIEITSDLERIGDLGKNIAKRVLSIHSEIQPTQLMRGDEEIDAIYNSLFRELLTYMMEDPRNIGLCTHLLFCAKNLERIGDHTTNIAENVHYLVLGKTINEARPKGDNTPGMLINQDDKQF